MTDFPFTYAQLRLFLDGMLVMMAVYALLSFVQQRKAIYWQYALYIGSVVWLCWLIDQSAGSGRYMPGTNYPVLLIESLTFMLYVRFAVQMLDVRAHDPVSYRLLLGVQGLLVGYLLLDGALLLSHAPQPIRSLLYMGCRGSIAAVALYVIWRMVRLRQTVIRWFVVGSLCFVLGCAAALIVSFTPQLFVRDPNQPLSFFITYLEIGAVLEVLCFTMGVNTRSRHTEQVQLITQARLIEQLQENARKQEQLVRIRADIARDLHDDVGGDLSSISMLSQAADRELGKHPEEARALLRLIGESSRQVLTNMRRIVWRLRTTGEPDTTPEFDPRNCQLHETALALFEHQPIQPHLNLPDPSLLAQFPPETCLNLYLLYKELLHNVVRHAYASNVYVSLQLTDTFLRLSVTDNGVGFNPDDVPATSNGLLGLRQRSHDLGGKLTISSAPGKGTTCLFEMVVNLPRRPVDQLRTRKVVR